MEALPQDRNTRRAGRLQARLIGSNPIGLMARRHQDVRTMDITDRRNRAASILANGLVRLLRDHGTEADEPDC